MATVWVIEVLIGNGRSFASAVGSFMSRNCSSSVILNLMKKADFLSVLITFVVGVLAGAYLFTTQFAPTVTVSALPSKEILSKFSITSEVYGGIMGSDTFKLK